jgi:hypothetical protein
MSQYHLWFLLCNTEFVILWRNGVDTPDIHAACKTTHAICGIGGVRTVWEIHRSNMINTNLTHRRYRSTF